MGDDGFEYNTINTFFVDQDELFALGSRVIVLGQIIGAEFNAIGKRWEGLKIGWAGKTQQEAEAFVELLRTATTDFFGEPTEPDDGKGGSGSAPTDDAHREAGVLSRFAGAIMAAAIVYDTTENEAYTMFKTMTDEVTQMTTDLTSEGGGDDKPQDFGRNYTGGPITEITPAVRP